MPSIRRPQRSLARARRSLPAAALAAGVFLATAPPPLAGQRRSAGPAPAGDTAAPVAPGDTAALHARLGELFLDGTFREARFGPARWLGDGSAYTTLERSPDLDGARDIVRYETGTGKRSVLVPATRLVPPGSKTALEIDDYAWSPDGTKLLVFTNTRRVWRRNTRGDYWVLDLGTWALRKLGGPDAPESTLMFAKFSPRGDRVAYVRQGDLYVERLADGAITRLTSDGSKTLVNGTSDWVYEEEFDLRDGFRWSPDGTKIAFWQFDMSGVRDFLLIDDTDSLYSFTVPVQYPKAGTTNSAVRVGVVPAAGGATTWLDVPGEARDNYLPWMEWVDAGTIALQRMNRAQDEDRVMLANAATGKARTVLTERDSAWIDLPEDVPWLDGGKAFLWPSERDGWRHLYRVSRDGQSVKLLTPGEYDVVSVAGMDAKRGWLYVVASPEDAARRYLYRVPLAGGRPTMVTPSDKGWNSYDISPDGRWAIHDFSTADTPPFIDLVSLPQHRTVRVLEDNAALRARIARLVEPRREFFRVTIANGATIDGWMLFPRDFDPSKRYPMLWYVYSEPAAQTAVDRWSGSQGLWFRTLADQGYIVATADNRGTPAPKGRAWRKALYHRIGILNSAEQADAVRTLEARRPYIDPARVGVWGWSGGGSETLNLMFRSPDIFSVGMSVAPVPDERLYDTVYQERYMGLPQVDSAGYREGSPINHAEGLRGSLLVVHGSGDDNVHYQGTERLVNRLVELGKPFQLMVYPNRTHCICQGRGTTLHVYSLLTRYLETHLAAGPRAGM